MLPVKPRKEKSKRGPSRMTRKKALLMVVITTVTSVIVDKAISALGKFFQSKGL